jgi:hypothetical protein
MLIPAFLFLGNGIQLLCVGVQSAKEKIDAEIGEEDAAEPDDGQPCYAAAAPSLHGTGMEESGIYQPGNQ